MDYATREDVYRIVSEAKWDVLKWVVGLALAQISLLVGVLVKLVVIQGQNLRHQGGHCGPQAGGRWPS